ncbi:hypothetical protein ACJZ2D_003475 [Fusarium nematophilum]
MAAHAMSTLGRDPRGVNLGLYCTIPVSRLGLPFWLEEAKRAIMPDLASVLMLSPLTEEISTELDVVCVPFSPLAKYPTKALSLSYHRLFRERREKRALGEQDHDALL